MLFEYKNYFNDQYDMEDYFVFQPKEEIEKEEKEQMEFDFAK